MRGRFKTLPVDRLIVQQIVQTKNKHSTKALHDPRRNAESVYMIWHHHWPMTIIHHYNDVTMGAIASQLTSITIVYSTVSSGADQRKHHSSASLAFVCGIHRWPVNSPHKWPVTLNMFPFFGVIMCWEYLFSSSRYVRLIAHKTIMDT